MKGCVCTYPKVDDKKCKHCGFFELTQLMNDNKLKEEKEDDRKE